jgi:hypothetical protein
MVAEWPSDQVTKWPSDRVTEWPVIGWGMNRRIGVFVKIRNYELKITN